MYIRVQYFGHTALQDASQTREVVKLSATGGRKLTALLNNEMIKRLGTEQNEAISVTFKGNRNIRSMPKFVPAFTQVYHFLVHLCG